MRKISLSALFLLYTALAFAQYTPSTVPNTKLVNNSYVSNPDGLLDEGSVARIDSLLVSLENRTTVQVAVVVLKSIGDYNDSDFAQELFQLWGIGRANNNGLLILVVDNPRMLRFQTGRGIEGALPDVICKRIQREQMVSHFKQGHYGDGIVAGILEVDKILTDPKYTEELKVAETPEASTTYEALLWMCLLFFAPVFLIVWATKSGKFSNSKEPSKTEYPWMRMKRSTWLIEFGGIPALILFLFSFVDREDSGPLGFLTIYGYLLLTVFHRFVRERQMISKLKEKRKYYEIFEYLRQSTGYWFFIGIVFPFPFLAYIPVHFVRRRYFRNYPRKCQLCEGSMFKLGEDEEDQYLTKTQILEEDIKSVNYDVWKCKECGGTEEWHYLNRHTSFKECPSCKAIAYYVASSKTLKAATYTHSGRGELLYQCKACNKSKREEYSIAQLVHTTSSSSSSSSSSYSSSSSSSSSGGSWGGGSSGGGGASSTW